MSIVQMPLDLWSGVCDFVDRWCMPEVEIVV